MNIRLPYREIRRLISTRASALIVTRELKPEIYALEDCKHGDEIACVRVCGVRRIALGEVDYPTVRSNGYKTQRDFYDAWYQRHDIIRPRRPVTVAVFVLVEDARWLHKRVHRGYTRNPALATSDHAQALDEADLERYANDAALRRERERREELRRARARSLGIRIKQALLAADHAEVDRLIAEIAHHNRLAV